MEYILERRKGINRPVLGPPDAIIHRGERQDFKLVVDRA